MSYGDSTDSHMSLHAAGICFRLDDDHLRTETCSQSRFQGGSCLSECTVAIDLSKLPPSMHAVCYFQLVSFSLIIIINFTANYLPKEP